MPLTIRPFDPDHTAGAVAHAAQSDHQYLLDDPTIFERLWPDTYSAFADGELIAIGGTNLFLERPGGWVLFANTITPNRFVAIHRTAVRFLRCFEDIDDRLFADVDPDNPQSVRWARLLDLHDQGTDTLPDGRQLKRMERHAS